ncbi:LuxR C-terminal-related transcriptional regulator [Deinococcus planocerae]|uniref:LuxR C-terminal-related transcriptional regulator n=1 Tax=Deinococcus planocerae TaxID=1737569 RepID=UPI001FE59643|nr:LuxR C-terminal-related transcriptional regulator [Deinococcus planocerae]
MTTPSVSTFPVIPHRYRLCCGVPALAAEIEPGLQRLGWGVDERASLGLMIDAPFGYALHRLEQVDPSEWVVVTDNPCPEYWEDLWSFSPRALLAGGYNTAHVAHALGRAAPKRFYRHTPLHDSSLTCVERRLLRSNAQGWENKRIAQELGLNEGTVRNGLSRIFQKLGVDNRTQLALYYWGLWHPLERWPGSVGSLADAQT